MSLVMAFTLARGGILWEMGKAIHGRLHIARSFLYDDDVDFVSWTFLPFAGVMGAG